MNQTSSNNEFNYYTQIKNARNYNIFEFKDILNLTEKVSNNTNYVSLSTYYEHFRTVNNNYNQIKNNLNFVSNQVDYLTKINFNNKNTINKLFNTQNTYRNSILNMINNITKVQKLVFNENDFHFRSGLVKTINNLNRTNTYQINQLREQLNLANINMTFLNHKMFRYEVSKIEQTKKELNNILNIFDENGIVSNTFVNKLSSTFKDNNFIDLLNLSTDEKHIQNVIHRLKQSTSNIHAVKNLIDIVNLSKESNFQIEKFNSNNITSISKILNLTKNTNNLISNNRISNNLFSSSQENLTQEQVNGIQQNQNILKNINLSEFANNISVLKSYSSKEINNAINLVNVLSKDIKLSNVNLSTNELKSLNLITEKIDANKINNLSLRKISKISNVNVEDIEQISENINIHQDTFKKINLLSSNVQKISKLLNVSNNTDLIEKINLVSNNTQTYKNLALRLSSENINQFANNLNIFSENKSVIKKISRLSNSFENVINDTTNVIQNNTNNLVTTKEIVEMINIFKQSENKNSFRISNNVTLSNQQVRNLINLSQSYNQRVVQEQQNILQKTSLLQSISEINLSNLKNVRNISNNTDLIEKINIVSNNIQAYKNITFRLSSENIDQISKNLNVFNENKTQINKISRVVNNKTIKNLDQSFVDNVSIFQTKISNFADKSKLKETIENLNITTKNVNNIFSTTKLSQIIRKTDLKENI